MDIACVMVDGDREFHIERGTDAWVASMEWARFHGLNPNRIPFGSVIVRDEAACRIVYESFVDDEQGQIEVVDLEPVVVRRVEQGEAPPLPLPPEVVR